MRSLRARLILSHIIPLLIVIPLVGIALTYLLETQVLLAGLSTELERQALLVAAVASDYPEIWFEQDEAQAFADMVGGRLSARVSLLRADGVLLASTDLTHQTLVGQQMDVPALSELILTGSAVRVDYGEQPGTGAAEVLVPAIIGPRLVGVIQLTDPLSNVYERFPRTRTLIASVVLGGLVLGMVIGWLFAVSLGRTLRRATDTIQQMASGQALAPVSEQGPQEVRLLLHAFNTLTGRLQNLEKARQRLLANLVHELGRPLGALLSATQALSAGASGDPELRKELLSGMETETMRMQRLLDDITHLYDQTPGSLELERKPVALHSWLGNVLGPWREATRDQQLSWHVDLPDDLPVVEIDSDRLAQALENVTSNAVKYTPSGGTATVTAGMDAGQVWIRVSDNGPSITSEEQERIFTPFYRGSAGKRFPQGMGLGLSIARDLVAAHNGRIELESAPGTGSVFTICIPRN